MGNEEKNSKEEELLRVITEMVEVLPMTEKVRILSYLRTLYFS